MRKTSKFCLLGFASIFLVSPSLASDTITVNWSNNTGKTITLSSSSCTPVGSCNFPTTIPNGTTRQIIATTSANTFARSLTARYRYSDNFITKSCAVYVSLSGPSSTKPGPGCERNSASKSFLRGDGTGSSPICSEGLFTVNYDECTATYNVNMSN